MFEKFDFFIYFYQILSQIHKSIFFSDNLSPVIWLRSRRLKASPLVTYVYIVPFNPPGSGSKVRHRYVKKCQGVINDINAYFIMKY
jgi:hypothetical protein